MFFIYIFTFFIAVHKYFEMHNKILIIPNNAVNLKGSDNISAFYESLSTDQLEEVEVDNKHLVDLSSISVDVFIDCAAFNVSLIRNWKSLEKVVTGFLELFVVCKNAVVSLEDIKVNYGIQRFFVTETDTNQQGFVTCATLVTINKVRVWPRYSYEALAGVSEAEKKIQDVLSLNSLENPVTLQKVLLIGPSGTGKISLIRNLSLQNNAHLFEITSNDVIKSLPGDTEAGIRETFERAKSLTKILRGQSSIIMIKNIELLCPKEVDPKDTAHVLRISSQVMSLLETLEKGVVVIGTSSNIEAVDLRLRRPGRIDEEVFIRMPDVTQREEILRKLLLSVMPENVIESAVKDVAFKTNGYVGSDLVLVVKHLTRVKLRDIHNDRMIVDDTKWEAMILEALKKVGPSSMKGEFENRLSLNKGFDTIGGMDTLKSTIRTSVLGPLRNPESFERFGLTSPRGILLYGPPGCAKTSIAQCIASETKMTFYSTSAAEIYSPYVGKAEKYLVKLFNQARISAPSIIFLDEIDALVGNRNKSNSNDVQSRILSTLLTEMDGIGSSRQATAQLMSKQLLVIAATNRPDMIDDALMRPGRFDKLIHVPAPDEKGRLAILNTVKNRIPFEQKVDFDQLAKETEGFSGADLINLCNEAALVAATKNLKATHVTQDNLREAYQNARPSLTENQIKCYYEFESQVKVR